MIRSLKKTDLDILLKIFIPGKYTLFIENLGNIQMYNDNEPYFNLKEINSYRYKVLINFSQFTTSKFEDYDYVIDFANCSQKYLLKKDYGFICNNDKSIRWIYPSNTKSANFLNFYNASGWKAKLKSKIVKTAFQIGLGSLVSRNKISVYHRFPLQIEKLIEDIHYDNYSVFTGTVGPNRKLLVELNLHGKTTHFAKWAITDNAKKLILNEAHKTEKIHSLDCENCIVPVYEKITNPAFIMYKNIKPLHTVEADKLTNVHLNVLCELYEKTITSSTSDTNRFNQQLSSTIYSTPYDARIPESERISQMLKKGFDNLELDETISFSMAHMDFTPWNMYNDGQKLHIYDWELSGNKVPVLYDLFHFVFQKNILINRSDLKTIHKEINAAIENPIIQNFINKYKIDTTKCYQAYLLHTISYYLKLYSQQDSLHMQVYWLTNIWQQALEETYMIQKNISQRKLFIKQLINYLQQYDYALMKFSEMELEILEDSSDLDLLIKAENMTQIINYIKTASCIKKTKEVHKTFMTTLSLFFEDGSFLGIDLLHNFKRKTFNMFSPSKIIAQACITSEGVKIPQNQHNFEYIVLFYQLNGADVPAKYVKFFESLNNHEKGAIIDYINIMYDLDVADHQKLFKFSPEISSMISESVRLNKSNTGLKRIQSIFNYLKDTVTDLFFNKGLIITVSGVDGAGKSTIIEELKNTFADKFRRKVVVLRHRPSFLPILSSFVHGKKKAESMAAERLPRQGKNNSSISSLLRFSYYYSDYFIGQIYVYLRYVLRGYTVIYDRYYFDFIEDSKRSNIKINKSLIHWLYKFIYKPNLNILLYAPAEVILKRKQELKAEDITNLTNQYLSLFNQLSHDSKTAKYLAIENNDKNETIDSIVREYVNVA